MVGEPAGEPECLERLPNEPGASLSSMSMGMLEGSEANSEEEPLARRRLGGPGLS